MKLLPLAILCFFLQAGGQPSFIKFIGANDWQLGAGSGVLQLPDGTDVVYAGYGGSFSLDLGVSPKQLQASTTHPGYFTDGVYVVDFSFQNYFPPYPAGYYTAEVSFGTQELCETSGWAIRNATDVILVCPASAYLVADQALPGGGPVQGGEDVVVRVTVDGWTLLLHHATVKFTASS